MHAPLNSCDMRPKLSLKERYVAMTQGLAWNTTYQPMEKVFPFDRYEGIRIHDWDLWEDPFRLTMDTYWKYQGEKDKKLYAVIDAFAQNNGHMGISDARYVNAIKLFIQAVTPVEYGAHRGFAHVGRQFTGAGPRVACQMQAVDELRHFQTETHAMSHYNKYYNGMHRAPHWFDHLWYLSVPKSFFEDAFTAGPFEFLTAISFSFGYLFSNLLFVPFMSGAAYNGDMATAAVGFSAQSDESRHMTLGIECIKFLLEQDPGNVPIVQRWIDKWFWRGYRLLTLVAMMQDYMLPRKVISWKEAWEMYVEANGGALFKDLERYGIREPRGWKDACEGKEHISHQAWAFFYQYTHATAFHTWIPGASEIDWLTQKYPSTFAQCYRPRLEHWRAQQAEGHRFYNMTPPTQCPVCQMPIVFTEAGNPTQICSRETTYSGIAYRFCSDHCRSIFTVEPEKFAQARLLVRQVGGELGDSSIDRTWLDVDLWKPLLAEWRVESGADNLDFEGSIDQRNFAAWSVPVSEVGT